MACDGLWMQVRQFLPAVLDRIVAANQEESLSVPKWIDLHRQVLQVLDSVYQLQPRIVLQDSWDGLYSVLQLYAYLSLSLSQ